MFDRDELSALHRVIAADARGHGRSTNVRGSLTFERCARDVLAIMDRLGIDRMRAIGTSLGANTLLHVATLAPARVEAMVLGSATPRYPASVQATARAALLGFGAHDVEDPSDLAFTPERLANIPFGGHVPIFASERERFARPRAPCSTPTAMRHARSTRSRSGGSSRTRAVRACISTTRTTSSTCSRAR